MSSAAACGGMVAYWHIYWKIEGGTGERSILFVRRFKRY